MISIDCTHPDLEEFIDIKTKENSVTKANISVRVTDEFMEAVELDKDWTLSFKRKETGEVISKVVNARDIFKKLCKNNWDWAEPGILYWDRITDWNLLSNNDGFEYAGTNPCAEEPLPAGGSCLLGSLNLSAFVKKPYTPDAYFDFSSFVDAVEVAVIGLNDVLDEGLPLHPLQEQRDTVRDWRQIGLGIMGLADMFIKLGVKYGSPQSVGIISAIGNKMINKALSSSAILSKLYGTYPKYDKDVMKTEFFTYNINHETCKVVEEYGLRNSQLLTCAPTGTIATMIGVSNGIEPLFAKSWKRKTISLHNEEKYYTEHPAVIKQLMEANHIEDESKLPECVITAQELDPLERIEMQSAVQRFTDASISSTINLPNEASVEDVCHIYFDAWEKGLKGVTIHRAGSKRGEILTEEGKENKDSSNLENKHLYDEIVPVSRKKIGTTAGKTYCKKTACGTLYITINKDTNGNVVESFVNTSKGGICQSNINAINRMISVALRSGVRVEEVVDQLKGITCPACIKVIGKGNKLDGISCPDVIGKTLMEFYKDDTHTQVKTKAKIREAKKEPKSESKENPVSEKQQSGTGSNKCPDCGEELIYEGGCVTCLNCGWSKCE